MTFSIRSSLLVFLVALSSCSRDDDVPSATCSADGCRCDDGYSRDGAVCVDVDECAAATAACDPNADCSNVPGSFTCKCRSGFTGPGTYCEDVDECSAALHACHADALCGNTAGSYTCSCPAPLIGNGFTCVRPWSDPVIVGLPLGGEKPPRYGRAELASDEEGNLLVALGNGGEGIHVRRYDASDATWSEVFDLTGSLLQAGNLPLIDADAAGNAIVVWHEANDWESGSILAMRYDAAQPFTTGWSSTPEVIAGHDGVVVQRVRRLEMDDAGHVLVAVGALRNDGSELKSVSEVRVAPAGKAFGAPVVIPGAPDFASIATRSTTSGFELLAAWTGPKGTYTQSGRFDRATSAWTWGDPVEHAAGTGEEAVAALDSSGGRYIAWLEGERWLDSWVRVRHAPSGGTWGPVVDLDVYPEKQVGAVVPESLLLQAGRPGEAQVLFRSFDADGTYGHLAAHRKGMWQAPIAVDEDGSNSVAWIHGAQSDAGLFLVAWDRLDSAGRYEVVVRVSLDGTTLVPAHVVAAGEKIDRYWATAITRAGGGALVWVAEAIDTHATTNEAAILTVPGDDAP